VRKAVLLDTGPLVALLDRRDRYHEWAKSVVAQVAPPMFTCEPVLTEAFHLLRGMPPAREAVLELLGREVLSVSFHLQEERHAIEALLRRYADRPISLADACLVRMSELMSESVVFTLDTDFHIYRQHRRTKIPLLIPPDRQN